jgi:hypothetical protein
MSSFPLWLLYALLSAFFAALTAIVFCGSGWWSRPY